MKNLTKHKVRGKLVRKGLFTQLPLDSPIAEREMLLFRTVLDYALFDITSSKPDVRYPLYEWLDSKSPDFKDVCSFAGLMPNKVEQMFDLFIEKFFPEIYDEITCHRQSKNDILGLTTNEM